MWTHAKKLCFLLLLLPVLALADDVNNKLEPLPEPPPPPPGYEPDPDTEPQIVIRKEGENTVEEYSINGQVYMMKVTPPTGVPYYLSKDSIDGGWAPMDGPGEHYAVPQWVLFKF